MLCREQKLSLGSLVYVKEKLYQLEEWLVRVDSTLLEEAKMDNFMFMCEKSTFHAPQIQLVCLQLRINGAM